MSATSNKYSATGDNDVKIEIEDGNRLKNWEQSSNPIALLTLGFMNPLFRLGARRPLEQADCGMVGDDERVQAVHERFLRYYAEEVRKNPDIEKRSLWRPILDTVGRYRPIIGLLLQGIGSGCGFAPPLILKALSDHFVAVQFPGYLADKKLSDETVWTLVCMLLVLPVTGTICSSNSYVLFSHVGCVARNSIIPTVYNKSLVLGAGAKAVFSTGQVMNMFSNDILHIQTFLQNFAEPIFALPQLMCALALIYQELGVSMFVGLGLIIIVIPIMTCAILYLTYNRNLKLSEGDLRIKLTNEVLAGIRILKYFSWERAFEKKIKDVRNAEMVYLFRMSMVMPIFIFCIMLVPIVMPVLMFYCYVKLGNQLDPGKMFTVLALFGLIMTPVYMIPTLIQNWVLAAASIKRVKNFLASPELPIYVQSSGGPLDDKDVVISMTNAHLSWLSDADVAAAKEEERKVTELEAKKNKAKILSETEVAVDRNDKGYIEMESAMKGTTVNRSIFTLCGLTLTVKRGECVAIVGSVGSGKTSLLAGLLGELQPTMSVVEQGTVYMRGSVAYHAQVPWILNASVRDNIVFGKEFDEEKFRMVVEASCLGPDLETLPNSVDTEIGERGINLSGGQKARVSFARSLYRDADIILLDDPLSAVDAHVGDHIFHKGIKGMLKGKTVVLVTHQIHLIDEFDQVIIIEGGRVKAQGKPQDVKHLVDLSMIISSSNQDVKGTDEGYDKSDVMGEKNKTRNRSGSSNAKKNVEEAEVFSKEEKNEKGNLMTSEERVRGMVSVEVYKWYFGLGGFHWFILLLFVALTSSGVWSYSSFYLSDWGKQQVIRKLKGDPLSIQENVDFFGTYAMLNMLYVGGSTFRTVVCILLGINASYLMHDILLRRVLRAPIAFFDTTPIGRIINRFSADITQSDEKLGYTVGFVIGLAVNMLGIICTICVTTDGLFAIVLPPLLLLYYHVQRFFRKTNTELKRLENISRSPILTEFSQALTGASSLRAFGEENKYVKRMEKSVDENTTVNILLQICRWWLAIRLDFIGGCISFFVAALTAGDPSYISAEYLSLALQQAFSMTTFLKNLVQMASDVEAAMSNVERIKYYCEKLDIEEPYYRDSKDALRLLDDEDGIISKHAPPTDWPSEGKIEFKNISMRYRDGPLVLKGFDAQLQPREKIGVAGRTGSGKSSLMVSLFRIAPLAKGLIKIDDIDIATIPLHALRCKLAICPQDPVMFSATVRYNLDPFEEYSDEEIWGVLEAVQLKEAVRNLPGEINYLISEGGENFSTGQRALVNLARVLLRKPKILVLDEATASIDNETDRLIAEMIKSKFADCTVLTIAHRLHTIIDGDKVMILDAGELKEFDKPKVLLENPHGLFSLLWSRYVTAHDT